MREETDIELSAAEKSERDEVLRIWARLTLRQQLLVKARLALVRVDEFFERLINRGRR